MIKKRKTIVILFTTLFIVSIFLVGCGNSKLTEQGYSDKVKEFNVIFDKVSKDFYDQCELSINDKNTNVNLYDIYKDDIVKLNDIFTKYDENSIPSDKVQNFNEVIAIPNTMLIIEQNSMIKSKISKDICNIFVGFYDKRSKELGISDSKTTQEAEAIIAKPDLELMDKTTKYEDDSIYVVGDIRNNSQNSYSSVYVSVNLYGEDGNTRVGSAIDSIDNLGVGEIWKFKAHTSVEFKKYRVADIHGYK